MWTCEKCGRSFPVKSTHNCVDNPPPFPPLRKQAWNLAESVVRFVASGAQLVSHEEYRERLETCDQCDRRVNRRCTECGCNLPIKATGKVFDCPLGLWSR